MYHLQLIMVALIILGVTLGAILFSVYNMYVVVLLAVFGMGMTLKTIHHN